MNLPYGELLKFVVGTDVLGGPLLEIYKNQKLTGRGVPWCSRKWTVIVNKTGEHSSPLGCILNFLVGTDVLDGPKQVNIINKQSACHPELVEVFSSEERGKTEAPKRRRDLRTSLGGLPRQM